MEADRQLAGAAYAYDLDRMSGRYRSLEQERSAPRTVHSIGRERRWTCSGCASGYVFLEPLLDAEYGSATFASVTRPASWSCTFHHGSLPARAKK
jgi:hypothetical protein